MVFEEVYKKHYNELRGFGHQLNISADKCEDLAQETFLKFHIELGKNVEFRNPRAWLYKVYLNLFRTGYKTDQKTSNSQELISLKDCTCRDLHEDFVRNERQEIVFRLLEELDSRDKEILLLYNKGLTYAEIAEILDLNTASVGTMLVRAIDRLKTNIKIHYNELFEQS